MKFQILNYLNQFKVVALTLLVVASFVLISIEWHPLKSSPLLKCQVAAIILVTMYSLIIFELINRNLAALIGAALSIAAHDFLVAPVNGEDIFKWEDLDTLALLFGMMVIVNVLNLSGLFDFLAVWSYKSSGSHFWYLITLMSIITSILSALVDNVSTMLLMAPTIIKLSELEGIDPRYMLIIMVVSANIGGCATPIGDPPNLIIIGSNLAKSSELTFSSFTAYIMPATILALVSALVYLKLIYKSKESFSSLKQAIKDNHDLTWAKQTSIDNLGSSGNSVMTRIDYETGVVIEAHSSFKQIDCKTQGNNNNLYSHLKDTELDELMRHHSIKSKLILIKSLVVLSGAIILFFLQSFSGTNMTLGSISLFAGLTLLISCSSTKIPNSNRVADQDDESILLNEEKDLCEEVINKIEWSTLIFFFALFIVMEAMSKLGLTLYLGQQVTHLINLIPHGQMRSIGALTIILWSSGIASACIDNVPFTIAMVKVLNSMVIESSGSLDGRPLIFALSLGACLGGNGSLIGASCNLVTAGIADRHGYPITFNRFFRFAAPITLLTLVVSNLYLIFVFEILKL